MKTLFAALVLTASLFAQTVTPPPGGGNGPGGTCDSLAGNVTGTCNASIVGGVRTGLISGLPATCSTGDIYFATDAAAGANIYQCTATNTWSAPAAGGGAAYSQAFTAQTSVTLTHNLGSTAVITQCFDNASPAQNIDWNTLKISDSNNVAVTFSVAQSGTCVVTSGGGAIGPTGPAGSPGTAPASLSNQPLTGLGVEYVSGLTFSVGAGTYLIGGAQYSSPLTSVTLAAADPSNPRIDVIHVNNSSTVDVLQGTPAANPVQPTVDYSTELPLNLVLVPAGATTPGGIATTTIYDENTEWTSTCSAHIVCNSTTNPYRGTKDIEATAAVLGNNFTLVKPAAGTVDLSTQNTLVFYIRSKATWPSANGSGASGLRTLSLFWLNGATQVGLQVVLKDGSFGFSSSNITSYQQIAIPVGLFGTGSNAVTTLKAQVTGNGGTSSFGWYIDAISLQSGQAPLSLPNTLVNYKGVWNTTANYNLNDEVTYAGTSYVAIAPSTNKVPVTQTTYWLQLWGTPGATVPGVSATLIGPAQIFICTTTCTVTVPVPQLNYQFCVLNDDNVSTVITLAALGSSARYENTARTAYGTAGTGTLVSGGAVGDAICILGRDSTHYETVNHTGVWVAN